MDEIEGGEVFRLGDVSYQDIENLRGGPGSADGALVRFVGQLSERLKAEIDPRASVVSLLSPTGRMIEFSVWVPDDAVERVRPLIGGVRLLG